MDEENKRMARNLIAALDAQSDQINAQIEDDSDGRACMVIYAAECLRRDGEDADAMMERIADSLANGDRARLEVVAMWARNYAIERLSGFAAKRVMTSDEKGG